MVDENRDCRESQGDPLLQELDCPGASKRNTTIDDNSQNNHMPPCNICYTTNMSVDGIRGRLIGYLECVRTPLAEYQEKRGIPKDQFYTFIAMLIAAGNYIFAVLCAMGNMIYQLLPIIDAALLVARFIVDKSLDVLRSEGKDRVFKGVVFAGEFMVIVFLIMIISGVLLVPIWILFYHTLNVALGLVF